MHFAAVGVVGRGCKEGLTCPPSILNINPVMEKHTYKELELVKLLSEAIDELNQIGCEDIANDLQEKLENLLGLSKA
jgi:hypothetical protein